MATLVHPYRGLTYQQTRVLLDLTDGSWHTGADLARSLGDLAPVVGAHATAASLVRRGFAEKLRTNGLVRYRITVAGQRLGRA